MSKKTSFLAAMIVGLAAILLGVPEGLVAVPLVGTLTQTTDIDEAMKIIFEDAITESFVTDTETFDLYEQDMNVKVDETTGGRWIETAQLFDLPSGVGARAEGEYIPIPEGPTIVNSRINLKKIQATLEMTGEVFDTVRTNERAFVNYADRAMGYLVELMNHDLDRQLIGYGAGAVARVDMVTPAAADLAIDSAYGVAGYTKAWTLFQENETIRVGPNLDGTSIRAGSAKIIDVDPENDEIDLDGLIAGTLDNDYIFMGDTNVASSQTAAGVDREVMGLLGMIDDGTVLATFQNIARATYRKWQAVLYSAASAAMTETVLVNADDASFEKGGGRATVVLASRDVLRGYWADLKSDRSINDPRGTFEGGLKGLKIHLGDRSITLRASRKMPPQIAFGIDPSTLKRFHNVGFKWDDRDGSIWGRVTDGTGRKDAFFATGYIRFQTACSNPRKNFKITNIA